MFTRAGFNPRTRSRRICFAMSRGAPVELIQFEAGDLCWYSDGALFWGTTLRPRNFLDLPLRYDLPASGLHARGAN